MNPTHIHIVWNYTNRCPYHCSFCAAASNSRPTQAINKSLAILQSIFSINVPISLDFSGGDPLCEPTAIKLILTATEVIGQENVEISTTGLSLSKLSDSLLHQLAHKYALTYDFPKSLPDPIAGRPDYNQTNYDQALRLKRLGIPFEISLAVHSMPRNIVQKLAADLIALQPENINLIQIMPLGYNSHQKISYHRAETEQLFRLLSSGVSGKVSTNCAYRRECNGMCHPKLGLDEMGNLYGCIWAADLGIPTSKNDFYLGNLIDNPLSSILKTNQDRITNLQRNGCYVFQQISNTRN